MFSRTRLHAAEIELIMDSKVMFTLRRRRKGKRRRGGALEKTPLPSSFAATSTQQRQQSLNWGLPSGTNKASSSKAPCTNSGSAHWNYLSCSFPKSSNC
jgi:hypothetical protein